MGQFEKIIKRIILALAVSTIHGLPSSSPMDRTRPNPPPSYSTCCRLCKSCKISNFHTNALFKIGVQSFTYFGSFYLLWQAIRPDKRLGIDCRNNLRQLIFWPSPESRVPLSISKGSLPISTSDSRGTASLSNLLSSPSVTWKEKKGGPTTFSRGWYKAAALWSKNQMGQSVYIYSMRLTVSILHVHSHSSLRPSFNNF